MPVLHIVNGAYPRKCGTKTTNYVYTIRYKGAGIQTMEYTYAETDTGIIPIPDKINVPYPADVSGQSAGDLINTGDGEGTTPNITIKQFETIDGWPDAGDSTEVFTYAYIQMMDAQGSPHGQGYTVSKDKSAHCKDIKRIEWELVSTPTRADNQGVVCSLKWYAIMVYYTTEQYQDGDGNWHTRITGVKERRERLENFPSSAHVLPAGGGSNLPITNRMYVCEISVTKTPVQIEP